MIGRDLTTSAAFLSSDDVETTSSADSSIVWFLPATTDTQTLSTSTTGQNKTNVYSTDISQQLFEAFAITVGVAATLTNGLVLFLMIYLKEVTKKTTNTFIFNQTILDFIASIGIVVHMTITIASVIKKANMSDVLIEKWLVCLAFGGAVIFTAPIYSSQTGLIVITVERYFKIVHPIGHRKYFRAWMVKVGVVLPWIVGALIYVLPTWSSTRIVNGVCAPFQFPSTKLFQAYTIITIIYLFVIPLILFIVCYGKIIAVIRRQSQVKVATATGHSSAFNAASDGGSHTNSQVSKSEKKIIKTTLLIICSFFICWGPSVSHRVASNTGLIQNRPGLSFAVITVAYLNVLLNPLIYATHFDVVKRMTKRIAGSSQSAA